MAPPFGFKILMEKVQMIEDQCSDESDKKERNKKKLEDAESRSQDPFVRKKMLVQEKIAETREVRLSFAVCACWEVVLPVDPHCIPTIRAQISARSNLLLQ